MNVIFTGKNVEVTPAMKEYAESKIQKLARFFNHLQDAKVTQSILRNQHVVEVTLIADGTTIRAEERTGDMYTSIDMVIDKLERQLTRFKGKYITHTRESLEGAKPTGLVADDMNSDVEEIEDDEMTIVRTKRFAVKPMGPEEAAMEMELISHDFYVFRNAESDEVNVIYRRRDGNYGLIEPIV